MVFETLLSPIISKLLGDYVENLDPSQLNVGVWGGDIVLKNLNLKSTALDELELPYPIKVKSGFLAKLTLKIPWKNLYNEPVVAKVEGLYILLVPEIGLKFDPEKEAKSDLSAKLAQLAKLEAARKAKKSADKGTPLPTDSFGEKIATQIVKNLQVEIDSIHVRFEDQFTNRKRPFAIGITLNSLKFQLIDLDSMSIYWNSHAVLQSNKSPEEISKLLKSMIATKDRKPEHFSYILIPISVTAKLQLNNKPESDGTNFKTPKVVLTVDMKDIGLNMNKYQYQDMLDMLDFLKAQDRFKMYAKYRRFRPGSNKIKGHAKEWWRFAIQCVLSDVRRRRRGWSWKHMQQHRKMVKNYRNAWIEKMTNNNPSKTSLRIVEIAEKELDVFNLNVGRQQAEIEITKRRLKLVDQEGWIGWAANWWGGGNKEKKQEFQKEMNEKEVAKLFKAIDYDASERPKEYPKDFLRNKVTFVLQTLNLNVHDNLENGQKVEMFSINGNHVEISNLAIQDGTNTVVVDVKHVTMTLADPEAINIKTIEKAEPIKALVLYVLNPCDIKWEVTVTKNEGQHSLLSFSDIVISISPAIYRLVMSVYTFMTTKQAYHRKRSEKVSEVEKHKKLVECPVEDVDLEPVAGYPTEFIQNQFTTSFKGLVIHVNDDAVHAIEMMTITGNDMQITTSQTDPESYSMNIGVKDVIAILADPEAITDSEAVQNETVKALVLQFHAIYSNIQSPEQSVLNGSVTGLEVFSGFHSPNKREKNKKHILNSCEIKLTGSQTKKQGLYVDVTFSDIIMKISPSVIRLINTFNAKMTAQPEESIDHKKAKLIAQRHIWDVKKIKDCNLWYLTEVIPPHEAEHHG